MIQTRTTPPSPLARLALSALGALAATAAAPARALQDAEPQASALVTEGRELLAAGEVAAALERLEAAATRDPGARVWLARGYLADGRIDEALTLTDELKAAGAPEADLDYLYGLGFLAAAKRDAAAGGGTYTQGQFQDATGFLVQATAADPERYRDAFLPLAEAAWYAAELDVARDAAARAVALAPEDREALVLRGKVAFSSYTQARSDEAPPETLDARWEATRDAFQAAAAAYGTPEEELAQYELAGVYEQLGNLCLWREDRDGASEAFRQAMAWDPRALDSADFNRVRTGLGDERFATTASRACDAFRERHPEAQYPDHPGRPLLAWWSGFAAFENGDLPAAEERFLQAVTAHSGYLNSWYYVFRSAYGQRKYDQALIALRSYWKQDPDGLIAMIEGQRDLNLRILEYLVGWLIDPDEQPRERYREAAILAEIMTRAVPDEPRYWNNLGLFLRDYGDQLRLRRPPPGARELDDLWAQAFAAYEHTLELAPDHPAYLNDTAVMLHYYLESDYDRAEAMYLRAIERADEELAGKTLSTADRAWFETALTDARDNLEKLRAKRAAAEPGS